MTLHTDNFDKMANEWWDENGPMKPLHLMNPVRLKFIQDHIIQINPSISSQSVSKDAVFSEFNRLSVLDIGCGAGLLTEPLARMGFQTTGVDVSAPNIQIAQKRNEEQNLNIEYKCVEAEHFIHHHRQFDIVCALEVIEHVGDQADFVRMCARLVKPNGLLFFSTLNKTIKSYLLAILGAEYVLRLLPIGTHDHSLFVAPDTLSGWMQQFNVSEIARMGMHYNPILSSWKTSSDTSVNYIMVGQKMMGEA